MPKNAESESSFCHLPYRFPSGNTVKFSPCFREFPCELTYSWPQDQKTKLRTSYICRPPETIDGLIMKLAGNGGFLSSQVLGKADLRDLEQARKQDGWDGRIIVTGNGGVRINPVFTLDETRNVFDGQIPMPPIARKRQPVSTQTGDFSLGGDNNGRIAPDFLAQENRNWFLPDKSASKLSCGEVYREGSRFLREAILYIGPQTSLEIINFLSLYADINNRSYLRDGRLTFSSLSRYTLREVLRENKTLEELSREDDVDKFFDPDCSYANRRQRFSYTFYFWLATFAALRPQENPKILEDYSGGRQVKKTARLALSRAFSALSLAEEIRRNRDLLEKIKIPLLLSDLWTVALLGRENEWRENWQPKEKERKEFALFRQTATYAPDTLLMRTANCLSKNPPDRQVRLENDNDYEGTILSLLKNAWVNFQRNNSLINPSTGETFVRLQEEASLKKFPFGRREILVLLLVASKKPFDALSFLRVFESFRES